MPQKSAPILSVALMCNTHSAVCVYCSWHVLPNTVCVHVWLWVYTQQHRVLYTESTYTGSITVVGRRKFYASMISPSSTVHRFWTFRDHKILVVSTADQLPCIINSMISYTLSLYMLCCVYYKKYLWQKKEPHRKFHKVCHDIVVIIFLKKD